MGRERSKECLVFFSWRKEGFCLQNCPFEEFEIHESFNTADRSAWPVLKRNQAAKNFHVHFVL